MQPGTAFMAILILAHAASAQIREADLRSKIAEVRYAPLAEQARIQGDVRLKLRSGAVTVLSGHPLLALTAEANAKSLGSILGKSDLDMTYHFVLVDAAQDIPVTVKRGNAFERAILRLFGLKTEKVIYQCQEGVPPASDFKVSGANIEVWIYGTSRCLTPDTAEVLAQR